MACAIDRLDLRRPAARRDVGAVDREARDDFDQHVAQAVEREVARAAIALADAVRACAASTVSSLAIDVSMISRLVSYSRSSKLSVRPVSLA